MLGPVDELSWARHNGDCFALGPSLGREIVFVVVWFDVRRIIACSNLLWPRHMLYMLYQNKTPWITPAEQSGPEGDDKIRVTILCPLRFEFEPHFLAPNGSFLAVLQKIWSDFGRCPIWDLFWDPFFAKLLERNRFRVQKGVQKCCWRTSDGRTSDVTHIKKWGRLHKSPFGAMNGRKSGRTTNFYVRAIGQQNRSNTVQHF